MAQAQVTTFSVAIFGRNKYLIRDHLVFLLDDKIHDLAFVKLANNKIHKYYEQNIVMDHDIEFNDGCASQVGVFYMLEEGDILIMFILNHLVEKVSLTA